ncbi:hypothetical protein N7532_005591 [Penicillium argentinense]|uniref:Uncharacterized protein n=1 Tax=Penicillium argentinense TaxID=1131581 RepID=A0A9W9FEG9_9EURO|nr:uncharacterized protein N7532_005591 [Penicillium argentinense]KAJ5098590.1 hypothetical protein N7532_005591 [Penicillium argentinense]
MSRWSFPEPFPSLTSLNSLALRTKYGSVTTTSGLSAPLSLSKLEHRSRNGGAVVGRGRIGVRQSCRLYAYQ